MDQSLFLSIPHKNTQSLTTRMFKNIQGLSSNITGDIFVKRPENHCNTSFEYFSNTLLKRVSYLGPKI